MPDTNTFTAFITYQVAKWNSVSFQKKLKKCQTGHPTHPTPCATWHSTLHAQTYVGHVCVYLGNDTPLHAPSPFSPPTLIFTPPPKQQIVLPLDADFIVCPKAFGDMLHDRQSHTAYRQLYTMLQDQRSLVVLPAFNVLHNATREGEHNITRGNKDALIAAIAQGSADIFQPLYHASTQYDVWFEAHDIYPIYYGTKGQPRAKRADVCVLLFGVLLCVGWWCVFNGHCMEYTLITQYEPYFFAWRESLPSYDERFRGMHATPYPLCCTSLLHVWAPIITHTVHTGYHFNKLSYLFYLHSLGFEFHVHPDGWVAHMPHAKTRENLPWEVNNGENRRMRVCCVWMCFMYGCALCMACIWVYILHHWCALTIQTYR